MEKGQFIDVGSFNVDDVDCEAAPQTAEQYLKQVMASRSKCPPVVRVTVKESLVRQVEVVESSRDERAFEKEWQLAKCEDFAEKRYSLSVARQHVTPLKIRWPNAGDEDQWEELMLRQCHADCMHLLDSFPNHLATPPALRIVLGLSATQVNALIPYFVDWAESESLSRPIREWLYVLMLVLDIPVLHDVISALRRLVKMCKEVTMSALGDQLGLHLMNAAKIVEEQLDQEMNRLENLDEDDMEAIRRRRMEQIKKAQAQKIEMMSFGHGKYEEVADEKEFFEATKKSKNVVCLFYLPGNFRCKIVDKHFEKLAVKHVNTRFIHVNAEKVQFLVTRLNIRVIPTIAIVINQQTSDYIRGFDDLGGIDEFKTEVLEERLARTGVITVEKKRVEPKKKKIIRSCDTEYDNEEDW